MESEPQHLASVREVTFEPLRADQHVMSFGCGNSSLDAFLHKHALHHPRQGQSRTWVAVADQRVVAYYTLSLAVYAAAAANARVAKGMPAYDIPMILLARLAVDASVQGQGVGGLTLENVLRRIVAMSDDAANPQGTGLPFRGVLVHAIDERAAAFYGHYGFQRSPAEPLHLMLSTKDLAKSLNKNY